MAVLIILLTRLTLAGSLEGIGVAILVLESVYASWCWIEFVVGLRDLAAELTSLRASAALDVS